MRAFVHFVAASLLPALLLTPAAQADACDTVCRTQRFERRAVTQGVGTHRYYDETTASVRTFVVTRAALASGGARYDVTEGVATRTADDDGLFRLSGDAFAPLQLALPTRADAGARQDTSVFDLFVPWMTGSRLFGVWLGEFFEAAGVPVVAPPARELVARQSEQSGIRYGSALDRRMVRVVFKDGEAQFALSVDETEYGYVDGSARDLDGHRIPSSLEQMRDEGPYVFPGGLESASWRGFLRLLDEYHVAPRDAPPQWRCDDIGAGALRCVAIPGDRLKRSLPSD